MKFKTFLMRIGAIALLVLPPWVAVRAAIAFADYIGIGLQAQLDPILQKLNALPSLPAALLAGDYGLVAMLPFLFLYALPTAVVFAMLTEAYRSSGLLPRLSALLHPWTVKIGLEGEDLVRVHMGFGCNVPAVHRAKACNDCTKEACISAIAFGAACSYQHPATLAVLAAAGRADLSSLYLGLLVLSTVLFLRVFYGGSRSLALQLPAPVPTGSLQWPAPQSLLKHGWVQTLDFSKDVVTVFAGVCFVAALAAWSGLLALLDRLAGPLMALLGLPAEVASAVVMSAVRKNGMATILIDPAGGLKVPLQSASHLLGAVLLAGMVVPCVVTTLALAQSLGTKRASQLVVRQAAVVCVLVACLTWSGKFLGF